MSKIQIDFQKTVGPIKPMHAVNGGPTKALKDRAGAGNFQQWAEAGIPYARNHDVSYVGGFGGEHIVDVWSIFKDKNADVNDPASYDFALTDHFLENLQLAGTKVFYRLGNKIEHWVKKYGTLPPPDFQKWAEICEHIIRHYTEGWADGFCWDIDYWEIWNEPELDPDDSPNKRTWGGTTAQFYDLYEIAAKHLKTCFPHLKIGGPALAGHEDWAEDFLNEMKKRNVPIDFFSWHIYTVEPKELTQRTERIQKILQRTGYEQAENHCNEWNFVRSWEDNFIEAPQTIISMKGAAFIAGCMLASQPTCLDLLMYYYVQPGSFNGVFDYYTYRPLKGYYVFKMFNQLYRLGTSCQVTCNEDGIYAVAAKDQNGKSAVMVCYYTDESEKPAKKTLSLELLSGAAEYQLYLLDDQHSAEPTATVSCTDTVTLQPNTVILLESK